jgi:cell division protein YceG involved in septum cleavage
VFRNKIYLSGLGLGLILGAIMLQLMLVSKEASSKYSSSNVIATGTGTGAPLEEMDPQKLKAEVEKNFQVFDKTVKLYTQAQFDAELQKKLKEEKDKLAAAGPASGKRTYIYIQPNLPASSVAELLYHAEVVTDRRALEEELNKQNVTNKIQVGFHLFEGTPDVQQVIQNLITVR